MNMSLADYSAQTSDEEHHVNQADGTGQVIPELDGKDTEREKISCRPYQEAVLHSHCASGQEK